MKRNLLFSILTVSLLASCSSAYKSGQTPDDVYYSPEAEQRPTAVKENNRENREYYAADDRYLRMKVRRHNRWGYIDDYTYWNDSRYYSQNFFYDPYFSSSFYNPYSPYNSFYNGYNAYGMNPYLGYYSYCGYGNSFFNPYYNYYYPGVRYGSGNGGKKYAGSNGGSNLSAYRNSSYNNYRSTGSSSGGGSSSSSSGATRTFSSSSSSSSTSSSAGGRSGGYQSSGSSTSSGRGGRN